MVIEPMSAAMFLIIGIIIGYLLNSHIQFEKRNKDK